MITIIIGAYLMYHGSMLIGGLLILIGLSTGV